MTTNAPRFPPQSKSFNDYPCIHCNNKGFFITTNFQDPLGPAKVGMYCTCEEGQKLKATDTFEANKFKIGKRLSWDSVWMNLAKDIATKSTCRVPDRQIGCVIVSNDNTKVLAIGYNGSAKGDDNKCEYDGDVKRVADSRCTCIHAEMNALVKLDTSNPCKKVMYLTMSPCSLCYKLIVNAGISEVVYISEYSTITIDKLKGLGVKVRKFVEVD